MTERWRKANARKNVALGSLYVEIVTNVNISLGHFRNCLMKNFEHRLKSHTNGNCSKAVTVICVNKIICCKYSWDMKQFLKCEICDRCDVRVYFNILYVCILAFVFYFELISKTTQLLDIVLSFDNIQHLCGSSFIVEFWYLCWVELMAYNTWHNLTFVYSIEFEFIAVLWFFGSIFGFTKFFVEFLMSFLSLSLFLSLNSPYIFGHLANTFELSSFFSGGGIQISRIQFCLALFCFVFFFFFFFFHFLLSSKVFTFIFELKLHLQFILSVRVFYIPSHDLRPLNISNAFHCLIIFINFLDCRLAYLNWCVNCVNQLFGSVNGFGKAQYRFLEEKKRMKKGQCREYVFLLKFWCSLKWFLWREKRKKSNK